MKINKRLIMQGVGVAVSGVFANRFLRPVVLNILNKVGV